MSFPSRFFTESPATIRVVPFVGFVLLTSAQGRLGPGSEFWVYAIKTVLAGLLLWWIRNRISEMRGKFTVAALMAGLLVAALWIAADPFYPKLGPSRPWNPVAFYGQAGWIFVAVRLGGSTLLVPLLEEVFFRSFLYRSLVRSDFQSVSFRTFVPWAFFITSILFGLEHHEWLAGIVCGMIFQWLVIKTGRIGDAIVAHATTNLLLGLWVIWKGAWHFW